MHYGSNYRRRSKRTSKIGKTASRKKLKSPESYYDINFDWDLIVSSFAQQYGIRLHTEYETISCEEFRQLLVGLNGDTPLGYTVQIRSEKDSKKINQMTNKEKQIRQEWHEFCSRNKKSNKVILTGENINSVLSKMFG